MGESSEAESGNGSGGGDEDDSSLPPIPETPLECAFMDCDFIRVQSLLRKTPEEAESLGLSRLALAILGGSVTAKDIHTFQDEIGKRQIFRTTALMIATGLNRVDLIEPLSPEYRAQNANGVTALMIAALNGYDEAVRLLLEVEKGLRVKEEWGLQSVHGRQIDIGPGSTALMIAAEHGHTECVRILLDSEAGLRGHYDWTALMHASTEGYLECVKMLVPFEAGIVNTGDVMAINFAAARGHAECLKILMEYEGVKEKGTWYDGRTTALISAAEQGRCECVSLLVTREAGERDWTGFTALMKAVTNNKVEVIPLLKAEVDLPLLIPYRAMVLGKTTIEFDVGDTALTIARYYKHEDCIRALEALEEPKE
ncbi:Ankyrin repeat protein 1 [Giardia muris]|uniref:Ankyrin repeat protein 1 n=1 Tax=Giardia muris TaxID=5742 RepID=A0A4Z1SL28_GIAMU|nr:Ankyrin repeat protein 1 [Giardia muris]|eukprot:TNJ26332.1 Ankyrin repeat protein 1 [Giardia muris]